MKLLKIYLVYVSLWPWVLCALQKELMLYEAGFELAFMSQLIIYGVITYMGALFFWDRFVFLKSESLEVQK